MLSREAIGTPAVRRLLHVIIIHGAMIHTPFCGTPRVQSGHIQVCSKGTRWAPMLFALVLRKLVSSIEADDGCFDLSLNFWYLDDGVLAGERLAVVCACR